MKTDSEEVSEVFDRVYLVDDDEDHQTFIKRLCESAGLRIASFSSPDAFLEARLSLKPGCLLVDMMMPGMDGLALFQEVARLELPLTCVLMTGFADTASCRAAFRAGMFDFIPKDSSPREVLETINRAIAHRKQLNDPSPKLDPSTDHWDVLTDREKEVAHHLIEGHSLKQIASLLEISVQTASKHRGRVFEKIGVSSEVELLKSTMANRIAS